MHIQPFTQTPQHQAQLVDLIHYCQNIEAQLNIKMAEQADIFEIPTYYQATGGEFWLALDQQQVVGSIALLPLTTHTAVLKKFFTYPKYRGQPQRLGAQLFQTFLAFAQQHQYHTIVLDTPEGEPRSHTFYEHHGFHQIARSELTTPYAFPDRNSRLYRLSL